MRIATRMERLLAFKANEALLGLTCMGINMTKNRAYRLPPFVGGERCTINIQNKGATKSEHDFETRKGKPGLKRERGACCHVQKAELGIGYVSKMDDGNRRRERTLARVFKRSTWMGLYTQVLL